MRIELREDYQSRHPELAIPTTPADPSELFSTWFMQAKELADQTANIMFLSTVTTNQRPTTRAVLLKEYQNNLYIFYTHYTSRKGTDMQKNPFVALTFYWHHEHRQIRIEGKARPFSPEASDAYFKSRPFQSQVATTLSHQSAELTNVASFKAEIESLSQTYLGREQELSRPETWGGIAVTADYYEFWQGRPSRIHERLVYEVVSPPATSSSMTPQSPTWQKKLLYP